MIIDTLAIDFRGIRPTRLAPPPQNAPACSKCHRPGSEERTRPLNRKGNAGRPYYKCHYCNKFLTFIDYRGNDPLNPLCYCGESSKTQRSGSEKRVSRGLFFSCRLGACDFYLPCRDSHGRHVTVSSDDLADFFIGLSLL